MESSEVRTCWMMSLRKVDGIDRMDPKFLSYGVGPAQDGCGHGEGDRDMNTLKHSVPPRLKRHDSSRRNEDLF